MLRILPGTEHPQHPDHLWRAFADLYPLRSIHPGLTSCTWSIFRESPYEQSDRNSSNQEQHTYAEEVDVVQDLIVEGEVIARNDVDASLLL